MKNYGKFFTGQYFDWLDKSPKDAGDNLVIGDLVNLDSLSGFTLNTNETEIEAFLVKHAPRFMRHITHMFNNGVVWITVGGSDTYGEVVYIA